MKPTPAPPLVVIQAELVLQFEVIAFDAPAQHRQPYELGLRRLRRHGGQPELPRGRFMARPFDEQPLFGTGGMTIDVAVGRANPDTGEARPHGATGALTPCHVEPDAPRQSDGQIGNSDGTMPGV